jgi:hypothetical protein
MSEKDETLPIFAPRSEFTAEMSNSLFFDRKTTGNEMLKCWNHSVQDFSLHQSLMKLCAKWQQKFWIVLNIMNCSLCFGRTSFSEIYLFSFNYRAWKLFYCLTKVQRISFHPCKLDYLVRTICFLIMNYFSYVLYFRLISKTKSCF